MADERVRFSDSDNLISTTTPDSHITYCNDDFCRVAGYQAEELLGSPHNVIRHNTMPKAAFGQLWEYIQSGKSWMGLVKNKCKDRGHYWVSAFVTPIMDKDGSVYEYQSVRSQPSDEQIARAESLYAKLQKGEASANRQSWLGISLGLLIAQVVALFLLISGYASVPFVAVTLGTLTVLQTASLVKLKTRLASLNQLATSYYDNPIMERPYTGCCDDISRAELALMMKRAELRAVTARASDTSAHLLQAANDELVNSQSIDRELGEQDISTDAMAVSAEEMLTSIQEVSRQATKSSDFANSALDKAQQGAQTIDAALNTVLELSQHLDSSKAALAQLYTDVDGIETILEMIQGIAEQTNLLALNAAIEAARAGQHGRGFAVVADEVRALSGKTSTSVEDIRSRIEVLQATVKTTGDLMEAGIHSSEQSVEKSQISKQSFEEIVQDLISIGEQSTYTAEAVTEQVQVTQGITDHVIRMNDATQSTKTLTSSSVLRTHELVASVESLQRLVRQFSQS